MASDDTVELGRAGLLYLAGTTTAMAVGFVFRVAVANMATPTVFGSLMLAISVLQIGAIPTVGGLNQGVTRFLSMTDDRREQRHYVTISLGIVLVLSVLLVALLLPFRSEIRSIMFDGAVSPTFVVLTLLCVPLLSATKVLKGGLRGLMETSLFVKVSELIQPLSRLVLVVAAAWFIGSAVSLMAAVLVSYAVVTLYGYKLLRGVGVGIGDIRRRRPGVGPLVRFSLPLMVSSSLYIVLTRVDRVMIGYFRVPSDVALYEIAVTLGLLIGIFHTGFSFLLFPKISERQDTADPGQIATLYQYTTKWILACSTPLFLLLVVRPDGLIRMFGTDYPPGVVTPVLIIVAGGLFVDAVLGPNGEALLGFGKSRRVMYYNLVSVGVNVVLNLLLIPLYGLVGAALALGAGYTVMNLLKSADLYRNHGISSLSVSAVPFAAGGVVVALPAFAFLPSAVLQVELVIAGIGWLGAVAAGFGALVLTGTATERDIALVRGLVESFTDTE